MDETTWLSAAEVDALASRATTKAAALDEIDLGIEVGTLAGRYAKRIIIRSKGPRQHVPAGPLPAKLWARIRENYPHADVWSFREWRLRVSPKEPATIMGGIELNERQLRAALALHGVPDLPLAPPPKPPKKRSGGHHMGAHGAVISSVVIDLLGKPIHEVRAHTELSLADVLAVEFGRFDAKREHISIENRKRMARHVLANVTKELERREQAEQVT